MSIPASLQKVVTRFERAPKDLRVQALLQYAKKVPPLPEDMLDDRSQLEQVHECQTPFFLDRKSTRLNSSHSQQSRMPSSA